MPLGRFVVYLCSLMFVCVVAFPRTVSTPAMAMSQPSGCVEERDGSVTCGPDNAALGLRATQMPRFPVQTILFIKDGGRHIHRRLTTAGRLPADWRV